REPVLLSPPSPRDFVEMNSSKSSSRIQSHQRSLIGDTGEGMQDSFDILEEKVKKAAELVKKLRRDNKSLDDQLRDSKAKLAEAEKKLAALEAQMGDAAGSAAKIEGLNAE